MCTYWRTSTQRAHTVSKKRVICNAARGSAGSFTECTACSARMRFTTHSRCVTRILSAWRCRKHRVYANFSINRVCRMRSQTISVEKLINSEPISPKLCTPHQPLGSRSNKQGSELSLPSERTALSTLGMKRGAPLGWNGNKVDISCTANSQ